MHTPIEFVLPRWDVVFKELLSTVNQHALLVSPYISVAPIEQIIKILRQRGVDKSVSIRVVTDLAPDNVLRGSTEPAALVMLVKEIPRTVVTYLPGLHAKVYISDEAMGIVTSANLTEGGLYRNYEYGIRLNDPKLVRLLHRDLTAYANLGSTVTLTQLDTLSQAAKELKELHKRKERQASKEIRQEFARRVADIEVELMKIRATGQSENSIFSATILYLLRKYGPLSTAQLHPFIQRMHPDLCNDHIDRVINGVHFGKRWKHMVRNAQQSLKKQGQIAYDGQRWFLTSSSLIHDYRT